ncbi:MULTISPECIES: hypothetical protein [unclassified Desulfovibrio]|uniref:hypothetical protein n=1 Tax=unclassified Desulfovibrio TaxID=2593640 RepID=UPI000F602E7C|nr:MULTISPECIES: hypothetical protein [unclassified Desulfovibrio]RRD70266.1 hypothetical protein EII24_07230 [Desulfovibrio sp. OH1209_COT-279]RRD86783.1 hypothetical protein EII23_07230 [Desulfovibrio sp. OH1186_COT-070]
MNTPTLSCSHCGSRNTEQSSSLPASDWQTRLMSTLRDMALPSQPGGRKFVKCKDCGQISMLHIL